MKYANVLFNGKYFNNLGDNMQIIALDYVYKKMGVPENEIVYIDYHELSSYNGEYVILPITMPMVDYCENGIAGRFSSHIIPVFISLCIVKDKLSNQEIEYLKKYEPIGCRDEITMNTLRKYGIHSYIHGCITAIMPKRTKEQAQNATKVFMVDVNSAFYPYIPEKILNSSEKRSHYRNGYLISAKKEAYDQYMEYINEAKLVITSLLHCASPCLGGGGFLLSY